MHRLERGEIPLEDFEHALAAALAAEGSAVEAEGLVGQMLADLAVYEDSMTSLVTRAQAAGVRTALLSNSWGHDYDRSQWHEMFDAVVISGEVGLRKPEPEIFALTLERIGLPAGECAFVDDLPHNVAAAAQAGPGRHRPPHVRGDRRRAGGAVPRGGVGAPALTAASSTHGRGAGSTAASRSGAEQQVQPAAGVGHHQHEQRQLAEDRHPAVEERDGPLVRQDDAEHVAGDDRHHLDRGDERGLDQRGVRGQVPGAEQVGAGAERVAEPDQGVLPLVDPAATSSARRGSPRRSAPGTARTGRPGRGRAPAASRALASAATRSSTATTTHMSSSPPVCSSADGQRRGLHPRVPARLGGEPVVRRAAQHHRDRRQQPALDAERRWAVQRGAQHPAPVGAAAEGAERAVEPGPAPRTASPRGNQRVPRTRAPSRLTST